MQAWTSVVNFHKCTGNEKRLLDGYCYTFGKGTWSIKVTPSIKVTLFHGKVGVVFVSKFGPKLFQCCEKKNKEKLVFQWGFFIYFVWADEVYIYQHEIVLDRNTWVKIEG